VEDVGLSLGVKGGGKPRLSEAGMDSPLIF